MESKDLNRLKVVLAEKKRANSAQPNLENLMEVAKCLEVDVKELLRM